VQLGSCKAVKNHQVLSLMSILIKYKKKKGFKKLAQYNYSGNEILPCEVSMYKVGIDVSTSLLPRCIMFLYPLRSLRN
jgi:hypothetical protein